MASFLQRAFVALPLLLILFIATPAAAHEGHAELPEGFRAAVDELVTDDGGSARLPGVRISVAERGIGLTVENTGPGVVEVVGEQAGEPLVRVAATRAWVNEASPQAKDVTGATVDPAAVADLIDLVWQRAEERWVALPEGGSVTLLDHRAAPGHPPARSEFEVGEVAGEFRIPFSLDGTPHVAVGTITAIPVAAAPPAGVLIAGAASVLVLGLAAGLGLRVRRTRLAAQPA